MRDRVANVELLNCDKLKRSHLSKMKKHTKEYQIFVVSLEGNTIVLDVNANWTVDKLMSKLEKRLPLPSRCYRLMCGSQELDMNGDAKRTLRDCQMNRESTVRILLRLLGGSTPGLKSAMKKKDKSDLMKKL